MGEGVLIGLDVGTTSSKAVVYTPEGRALAGGRAPTIWSSTPSGVEMAARDLLAGAIEAVNQAVAKTSWPRGAVRRLNIGEWIVRALGSEEASELSLASRTGWLDLTARTWWAESLSATEMKESLLPPLVTAGTALGRVANLEVSTALAGAVLTVAGHDHQAAAVGVGAARPRGDPRESRGQRRQGEHPTRAHLEVGAGTRDQRGEVDPRGDVQAFGPTSSAGCDRRVEQQSRAALREARHDRPVGAPRCQPGRCRGAALLAGLAAGVYETTDQFPDPA